MRPLSAAASAAAFSASASELAAGSLASSLGEAPPHAASASANAPRTGRSSPASDSSPALATTPGSIFVTTTANTIAERIPVTGLVFTSDTVAATSYANTTTPGPSVTAVSAAKALIFTSGQITKLLETQMKYEFLPQSVPSYSASEVLATLHTNDAVSAVTRLTDMGIEPFLLSSSLLGVLAQRLLRKTCTHCAGKGCDVCGHSGYQGRTGIFELLTTNDDIRALIHQQSSEAQLREAALRAGMTLMRDDGERLVRTGITSAEELVRVTRD